jgi:hypothetical protein
MDEKKDNLYVASGKIKFLVITEGHCIIAHYLIRQRRRLTFLENKYTGMIEEKVSKRVAFGVDVRLPA